MEFGVMIFSLFLFLQCVQDYTLPVNMAVQYQGDLQWLRSVLWLWGWWRHSVLWVYFLYLLDRNLLLANISQPGKRGGGLSNTTASRYKWYWQELVNTQTSLDLQTSLNPLWYHSIEIVFFLRSRKWPFPDESGTGGWCTEVGLARFWLHFRNRNQNRVTDSLRITRWPRPKAYLALSFYS